jgi:hypothetical protein
LSGVHRLKGMATTADEESGDSLWMFAMYPMQ